MKTSNTIGVYRVTQLAVYVNLHRAVIGPSATLTGRWRTDIDLRRMLTGNYDIVVDAHDPKSIYRDNPLTKDHMKFGERKHYYGELSLWGRAIALSKLLLLPSEKGSTIKGANLQILSFLKRPLRDLQCRRVNTITLVPFFVEGWKIY